MKHKIIIWIFCSLSLFICNSLRAHRDTIITYKDGKLIGLPKQYQPAEFDPKKLRLRIKNHILNIPKSAYLNRYFPENNKYELKILASWYHTGSSLPHYIVFKIKPLDKDFSHDILLNMDTLDVIKIIHVQKISPGSTRDKKVVLTEKQKQNIAGAIEKIEK